jgi:hypothetical protein
VHKEIVFACEMASLRRSNALSPDGQTARFLYTILKQLDLKAIDWNLVADGLNITNGHAARMRFSRFKQHMEGTPTQPRNPRPKKDGSKDGKHVKGKGRKRVLDGDIKREDMKGEDCEAGEVGEARIKSEPDVLIKYEREMVEDDSSMQGPPAVRVKRDPEPDGGGLTLPLQSQELVLPANLAFAPPATMTTQAMTSSASSPPLATVSLADLHMSTKSVPPTPQFDRLVPSFVFGPSTATPLAATKLAVAGVASEPGQMGSPMQVARFQELIKDEPVDA